MKEVVFQMDLFILGIGTICYFLSLYFVIYITIQILDFKHKDTLLWVGILIYTLPIFCVVDYMHRGYWWVEVLSQMGYYVIAFLIYYVLSILVIILIKSIVYYLKKKKGVLNKASVLSAMAASLVICVLGIVSARVTTKSYESYDIGLKQDLKVVAVSDIHYGATGSAVSLSKLVEQINEEQADLVLLLGDVFDHKTEKLNQEEFAAHMRQIKSVYGVYAITGNHEFMQNTMDEIKNFYVNTNIHLLLDESAFIAEELTIYGRIDHKYSTRKPIDIKSNQYPLLVLDHQPQFYKESKEANAFLQLSGHTHNGQIFPGNLLVGFLNRWKYDSPSNGVHHYDNFTLSITRGYGTWGFPLRLTGGSQMLVINLK